MVPFINVYFIQDIKRSSNTKCYIWVFSRRQHHSNQSEKKEGKLQFPFSWQLVSQWRFLCSESIASLIVTQFDFNIITRERERVNSKYIYTKWRKSGKHVHYITLEFRGKFDFWLSSNISRASQGDRAGQGPLYHIHLTFLFKKLSRQNIYKRRYLGSVRLVY